MAHAAPAPGRARTQRQRTPDVFGPRVHTAARWALPVVLGLLYGYWAAANRRDGGPITGWNVLFGFVTAFAFMVLYVAVRAVAPRLMREMHALAWAVFAGCAIGFLYEQGGATVLAAIVLGLVIAAAFFLALLYRFSAREDATGPGEA
ncbi:hypothetical protein AB0K80_29610 [Streptomyces sp. NPDC052682]|uniref:hypothetical protein n=1 Tax=Streptomyces sp. NPDC052682 TaxID=3154954 RepID=UPI0034267931